ncbi:MAG: hypothetical protein E7553_00350 [Ruminococcaceae bacterium]|nr:hypothetical protein [Oscillospiraceae bacterium]
MKERFSFSRLINSGKLMMVLSVIIAVALWYGVLSGPANIQERPLSVTVTVDLTNTYAHQSGLRVLGNDTFDVKVNVSGRWSVISKLDADDLRVRPDLSSITGAGDVEVPLTVQRNSDQTDYDIVSVSPRTVTVMCDYWQEGTTFKVTTDVSLLTAADPSKYQIGEPVLDLTAFPSGKLTVDGPQSTVSKISAIVARVDAEETLSAMKQFSVPLVALDKNGSEVDMTYCSIKELPSGSVSMTVPIWEQRHIEIGYTLENVPAGLKTTDLLTVTPQGLDVLGPSAELDALQAQLNNVGTVDLAALSMAESTVTFPLSIPSTVRAIDSPEEIAVSLNTDTLSEKTLSLVPTAKNIVFKGDTKTLKVTVPQQTLDQIRLIGDTSAINAITSASLSLEIDLGDSPKAGTKQYIAKLIINGYDDVWAYYGSETEGIKVYVTLA